MPTYDPHKTKTEVRQGSKRKMNSRVLVISMVAIIAIFAIFLLVSGTMQTPTP